MYSAGCCHSQAQISIRGSIGQEFRLQSRKAFQIRKIEKTSWFDAKLAELATLAGGWSTLSCRCAVDPKLSSCECAEEEYRF